MKTFIKCRLTYFECIIYGLVSGVIMMLLTRGGVTLSPDSINYMSIAKIINTGKITDGLVATWPPFFPMLIALINPFGFAAEESARIISVIMYIILVITIFLLAKATAGRLVAHLTSISMLFFAPILFVYSFSWSETVFITLCAVSVLFLNKFLKSTDIQKSYVYLIWGGVFTGLALLTRYVGVALFISGLLFILIKGGIRWPAGKIKSLILYSIIACAPVLLYLAACQYFKGQLPGYGGPTLPSFWYNLGSFIKVAFHDLLTFDLRFANPSIFPYVVNWKPNIPIDIIGKVCASLFILLFICYFILKSFKATIKDQIAILFFIGCYSLFFVFITSVFIPLSMETRFCSPIYPFLLIFGFFIIVGVFTGTGNRKIKSLFQVITIVVVLSFWFIQAGSSVNVFQRMVQTETSTMMQADITDDGVFDISDILFLLNYLFKNGPAPKPLQNANVNCDDTINIGDVVYLVNYVYKNGPPPCNYRGH
jgi:4-amino-4-deoxy-L-arabinose transferase-like glycosyltransferase